MGVKKSRRSVRNDPKFSCARVNYDFSASLKLPKPWALTLEHSIAKLIGRPGVPETRRQVLHERPAPVLLSGARL